MVAEAAPTRSLGGPPLSLNRHHSKIKERIIKETTTITTVHQTTRTTVTTIHISTYTPHITTTRYIPQPTSHTTDPSSRSSKEPGTNTQPNPPRSPGGSMATLGHTLSHSGSVGWVETATNTPINSSSVGGQQSTSHSEQRLSRGAIAGIVAGSAAMTLGLALVVYQARRQHIHNVRMKELAARPAGTPHHKMLWARYASLTPAMHAPDLKLPSNPQLPMPPTAKAPLPRKAVLAGLTNSIDFSPLSPISFVGGDSDNLSLLTARGTFAGTSTLSTPMEPQSAPADVETWRLRPLPPIPPLPRLGKLEKRKSPLTMMSPLSAPVIARRVSPFLTRAVRPRQRTQDSSSSGSAAASPNSGSRGRVPPTTSSNRRGRSRRVASDGGVRLAGGPPGEGTGRERTGGAARSLPPPYGARG